MLLGLYDNAFCLLFYGEIAEWDDIFNDFPQGQLQI
jgi:hypothetical protein